MTGQRLYSTGIPCKNGHDAPRYTANGICIECTRIKSKRCHEKRPWHPERLAAKARGDRHFLTGTPCPHGHDKRFVANGQCVECSIAKCQRWLSVRPGYEAAAAKRRRADDPTGHRAAVKRWAEKNPEKIRDLLVRWKDANVEYWRAWNAVYSRNRRSKKASNGGSHTVDDVRRLHALQKGKCAGCRAAKKKLEVDHIIAVIRGGHNSPSNLQLLCRRCNASKGAKDAIEWAQEHGRLL